LLAKVIIGPVFYALLLLWFILIGLGIGQTVLATPLSVAVIYPDIREPYRGIFRDVISGIEDRLGDSTKSYVLESDYGIQKVSDWLKREQAEIVIALGSRGLLVAKELQSRFKVIVGAVLITPDDNLTGISLTPDPKYLFQKLKELVPGVKRVTVIYNREHSGWLMERAQESARIYDLNLNEFPTNHLREAAVLYRDILSKLEGGIDAVWIPQDPSIDEQTILPIVLQESWERNLAVFSSNLAHIRNGALFALYPDNKNMGRSLADLALNKMHNGKNSLLGIMPLRDLFIAVNIRTAEHLGLKFKNQIKQKFNYIFPSQ
jgi:putative ABC transport system substrate-binding protein